MRYMKRSIILISIAAFTVLLAACEQKSSSVTKLSGTVPEGDSIENVEIMTWVEITPDSVAQLIGLDKNGNEVYEGDTIKHKRGAYFAVGVDEISKTTAATFKHYAEILNGEIVKVA